MIRIDVETTLEPIPTTWVRLHGSLTDHTAVATLHEAVGLLPMGATIVVDLDPLVDLAPFAAQGLADVSRRIAADHGRVIVVADDVDMRARLVLADIDRWATLLHSPEQVEQLLGLAA